MKKVLFVFTLITVLFSASVLSASAFDYEEVVAEIPVVIELGGTAEIIANEDSPLPEESEITIPDGETGKFVIHFDRVGQFDYTVKFKPDDQGRLFDKTEYDVSIIVNDNDGVLDPNVVIYKDDYKYGGYRMVLGSTYYKVLEFSMVNPEEKPEGDSSKNPKTGDDTRMESNFLIAMIASAGLLGLSIVYLDDSLKMVKAYRGMGQ